LSREESLMVFLLESKGVHYLKEILHRETQKTIKYQQNVQSVEVEMISELLTETINIVWKTFSRTSTT
jgi:hypothetical protein